MSLQYMFCYACHLYCYLFSWCNATTELSLSNVFILKSGESNSNVDWMILVDFVTQSRLSRWSLDPVAHYLLIMANQLQEPVYVRCLAWFFFPYWTRIMELDHRITDSYIGCCLIGGHSAHTEDHRRLWRLSIRLWTRCTSGLCSSCSCWF